jgi:tetratricopeptide (TPR) repeat protein
MLKSGRDRSAKASPKGARSASERSHDRRGGGAPAWLRIGLPVAVMGITFLVFLPALNGGFVNWDDDHVLQENEHFRGLGWTQLQWMATAYWTGHYHPLTWLSFAIDYRLWGLDGNGAFGFHLTNVILHMLNAGLFYLLARLLLTLAIPSEQGQTDAAVNVGVALAAMLFAMHPLRAESVAWVTERRDVLSVFFLLPCVLAYLGYVTGWRRSGVWYGASIVLLLLSLLCKAWGMTLPVVLLILDWYPLGRFRKGESGTGGGGAIPLLVEKLPFVVLAAGAAIQAAQAQSSALYTMKTLAEYGLWQRIAQGFYGIAFYLWKTLLPTGLAPIYEIPERMNPFEMRFIFAAVVVLAITAAVVMMRRRRPAGLALWACYVVVVSPVLGLAQSGPQLVADRYSYVACLTWAILAGAGMVRLVRFCATSPRGNTMLAWGAIASIGVLATLAGLTVRQVCFWHDSETLWQRTLAVAPDSYNAHNNMAAVLGFRGDIAAAEQQYRAALAVKPDGAMALTNLGGLLSNSGRYEEALQYLQRGLPGNPDQVTALTSLAITLQRLGRYDEAVTLYRRQLDADPTVAQRARLYSGLGGALGSQGKLSEAADCFRKAAALAPKDDLPLFNLGVTLRDLGDMKGALQAIEAAIRLAQDVVLADSRLLGRTHLVDELVEAGKLNMAMGDSAAARLRFQQVLQLKPDHAAARANLQRCEGSQQP